jgi:hypothetical protein
MYEENRKVKYREKNIEKKNIEKKASNIKRFNAIYNDREDIERRIYVKN